MEIKEKLDVVIWKMIGQIVGIVVSAIFELAVQYPNSVFGKFVYYEKKKSEKEA